MSFNKIYVILYQRYSEQKLFAIVLALKNKAKSPKGGKIMNKYELLLILSASNEEGDKDALIEKVSKLLEAKGATVTSVDKWGNKKLAYPINFKNDGYYVLMNFEANAEVPAEVQKQLNITADVYRAMFVRK